MILWQKFYFVYCVLHVKHSTYTWHLSDAFWNFIIDILVCVFIFYCSYSKFPQNSCCKTIQIYYLSILLSLTGSAGLKSRCQPEWFFFFFPVDSGYDLFPGHLWILEATCIPWLVDLFLFQSFKGRLRPHITLFWLLHSCISPLSPFCLPILHWRTLLITLGPLT